MYNKGLLSNSFTYEGVVNIKLKRNGKVYALNIHNTGTKLLVETIAKALSGTNVTENIPKYLTFICGEKNLETGEYITVSKLLRNKIPFVGKVYGDVAKTDKMNENSSCLLLSATISAADVNPVNISNNKQLRMLDSNDNILATIDNKNELLNTLYDSLKDGTDAIIEWRMIFSNKVEETK